MMRRYFYIVALVSNIIPILGVIFWNWDIATIIFLYWCENIIAAIWVLIKSRKVNLDNVTTIVKPEIEDSIRQHLISQANKSQNPEEVKSILNNDNKMHSIDIKVMKTSKQAPIVIFIFYFVVFTLAQGLFIYASFLQDFKITVSVLLAIVYTFISYALEYFLNYLDNQIYLHTNYNQLIIDPYKRLIAIQILVVLGGLIIVDVVGQNIFPLLLLIGIKILMDARIININLPTKTY